MPGSRFFDVKRCRERFSETPDQYPPRHDILFLTIAESIGFQLQLWDTAGQERFRKSLVQHYYRNVNAVVFVYDVTSQSSFDELPLWIAECDTQCPNSKIPRIIVGNKCDLADKVR